VKTKVLKIGIASREDMKARTLATARGELKPHADDPKVWFSSLESLAQVMSTKNQLLLEIIRRAKPASLKELAQISERKESNLSRTLHTMERYGLVELQKSATGTLVPSVPYERYQIEYSLAE
jgi:predicted transcriptional regulator